MTGRAVTAQFMPERADLENQVIEQGESWKEGHGSKGVLFRGPSVLWLKAMFMWPMVIANHLMVLLLGLISGTGCMRDPNGGWLFTET